MPGLALTVAQAARLFNLDHDRCARVLSQLVEMKVLANRAGTFNMLDIGRRGA
jgi:hypothetical protein